MLSAVGPVRLGEFYQTPAIMFPPPQGSDLGIWPLLQFPCMDSRPPLCLANKPLQLKPDALICSCHPLSCKVRSASAESYLQD